MKADESAIIANIYITLCKERLVVSYSDFSTKFLNRKAGYFSTIRTSKVPRQISLGALKNLQSNIRIYSRFGENSNCEKIIANLISHRLENLK